MFHVRRTTWNLEPGTWNRSTTMVTVEELRQSLPYPQTYTPQVALKAALSMERQPGVGIDLVLRPYILCQDWDKRVFIHWKDSRGVRTLEITRILEDSP